MRPLVLRASSLDRGGSARHCRCPAGGQLHLPALCRGQPGSSGRRRRRPESRSHSLSRASVLLEPQPAGGGEPRPRPPPCFPVHLLSRSTVTVVTVSTSLRLASSPAGASHNNPSRGRVAGQTATFPGPARGSTPCCQLSSLLVASAPFARRHVGPDTCQFYAGPPGARRPLAEGPGSGPFPARGQNSRTSASSRGPSLCNRGSAPRFRPGALWVLLGGPS